MKTNRTIDKIRTYNFTERNHWQLMADLSNNDYDLHYFGGRVIENDNFDYFIQTIEEDNNLEPIEDMIKYLDDQINETSVAINHYYNENNCYNEKYQGCMDELLLLIRIVKQEYCED